MGGGGVFTVSGLFFLHKFLILFFQSYQYSNGNGWSLPSVPYISLAPGSGGSYYNERYCGDHNSVLGWMKKCGGGGGGVIVNGGSPYR